MSTLKTILVLCADDRQGRKGGVYTKTAWDVQSLLSDFVDMVAPFTNQWIDQVAEQYPLLKHIDAGINGRCYKPLAIRHALDWVKDGDFLIYNDVSPELWENIEPLENFSLDVIHALTRQNNDILTCFVKWDCQSIPKNGLGLHIHKYFTTNRCMDVMGLREYENSYQHASGMICIRKTTETVKFVKEWLEWNLNPECASLGTQSDEYWQQEHEFKVGHRHDQSISGLLLNKRNAKLVDILYNDMNPYNFLQYCRKDQEYSFIDSNSPIDRETLDLTKIFMRRGSKVRNEQGIELTVWAVESDRIIVGQFEESAWSTSRDKLRLVR